jgi:hypothetical protein
MRDHGLITLNSKTRHINTSARAVPTCFKYIRQFGLRVVGRVVVVVVAKLTSLLHSTPLHSTPRSGANVKEQGVASAALALGELSRARSALVRQFRRRSFCQFVYYVILETRLDRDAGSAVMLVMSYQILRMTACPGSLRGTLSALALARRMGYKSAQTKSFTAVFMCNVVLIWLMTIRSGNVKTEYRQPGNNNLLGCIGIRSRIFISSRSPGKTYGRMKVSHLQAVVAY